MDSDVEWKSRIREAFEAEGIVPEDDVLEELAGHAQAMYEATRASGCSHHEASISVSRQIEFWRLNAAGLRRPSRHRPAIQPPQAFPSSTLSGLVQDVSYAARLLRREPRYALLAIVMMALATGATTALFSVTHGVLMRALPWQAVEAVFCWHGGSIG
jgi:hypothetical protein